MAPWQLWLKWSCEPLRLIAPTLGLKPTAPQKLDGRRIEPTTWVPRPAGTMPAPTAADEPLDEPPGVRLRIVRVLGLVPRMGGGEFRGRGLADDDGAGFAERMDAGGIAVRLLALEHRRALAGRHVGGLDDVLDRDRHAVDRRQRLAVAPARRRGVGGSDRAVLVQSDEGADGGIELDDALEGFLEIGARRGLAGAEIGRQSDIAPELARACTHGRTAGVSIFIPRARHIR